MTQTQQPKLSDMTGYEPEAVMVVDRKDYEALKALNAELLAALKRMVEAYREGVQDDREPLMVHQAIAAIAKAEGR